MAFDPFLYVALGAGVLVGRLVHRRTPWTGRATRATIVILVGLLGTLLDAVPVGSLALALPISLAFALLILGATAGLFLLLSPEGPPTSGTSAAREVRERIPFGGVLVAAVAGGFVVGRFVALPSEAGITWALYVMLVLIGFDLKLEWVRIRWLTVPLTSAAAAAVGSAVLFAVVTGVPWSVSFATSFAFGWYSLAGPLVAARAGALFGLLAFLTNFFRENLTMILSPSIGRRLRGGGLAAIGGATSMDTTLYFITRYGDENAGSLALAIGLVLTLTAGLVLPALLALPL